MKQLFANNAKTTLASSIISTDTSLTVSDGSDFPSPSSYEYFLCTLELDGNIEIVMVTGRSGNTFTIGGLLDVGNVTAGRGQEGTTAQAFGAGAKVECRLTKNTLNRASKNLVPLSSVDLLVAPKDAYQEGYVCGTYDPTGNPAAVIAKDQNTWRSLNYTKVFNGTVTASSTTSVTAASLTLSTVVSGKFLIQFTSGTLVGQIREVATNAANAVTWVTATSPAASNGDTFEILEDNISLMTELLSSSGVPIADNTGTNNAAIAIYSPAITSLTDNLLVAVVYGSSNSVTNPTFAPNALSAKSIKGSSGETITAGQLSGTVLLRYDSGADAWFLVANQPSYTVNAFSFFIGTF